MLRHLNNTLSDGQLVTATAVSTNAIDTGSSNLGGGDPVDVVVQVLAPFTGLTSVQVAVQDSADDTTYADVLTSRVFPLVELKATGKPFFQVSLPQYPNVRRYVKLNYIVVGTGTGGSFTAALMSTRR